VKEGRTRTARSRGRVARRGNGRGVHVVSSILLAVLALVVLAPPVQTMPAGVVSGAALRDGTARDRARFRVAVIGDFGSGEPAQRDIARRMCRYRRRHPFRFVLTTGDNIYPDGARRWFQSRFFGPYACLLSAGVRFRATLGNHDVAANGGRAELREPAFGMRARNYVWRRRGVRFVMVDSNRLRMRWLRRATRARRDDRWTVVVFHHPVFSPGLHGPTSGFRPGLPRLFRRRGVDLVLNGHDHLYSVTKQLRGIRYVVTGGGGASLYPCDPRWFTARCRSRYHFLTVTAGRRYLKVRAVGRAGARFARFRTDGRP
jgi:hypothetical protein